MPNLPGLCGQASILVLGWNLARHVVDVERDPLPRPRSRSRTGPVLLDGRGLPSGTTFEPWAAK